MNIKGQMDKKGFTIIELLMVLTVLALLIGITIPKMRGMQQSGLIVKAKGELQTVQTAVENYNSFNGSYPSDIGASLINMTPQIISQALTDPFASYSSNYQYYLNGQYYVIFSLGPDQTAHITGINSSGVLQGTKGDNICVTNGTGC